MIAIETRYLGPTNYKGSRYVAETCNGHRITASADDALNSEDNQRALAEKLANKHGWLARHRLVGGGTKRGMAWVMVEVSE